ncbi:metallophosphatase family protein [Desulfolithobacter dissulfuricans]|uniref:Metallophosphatase family protein n=1 Tax=Desulfolithobacter dissulfuricans TaxID=2795293 RepID=A0A915XLW6_9BACT|nr:metallophosphoesterase family protein [Desulfolithobacter dissulfuricans]BCO10616.1 metallophosphatase family protein [Desulfolithobacter dissulfuricans]
MRLAVFADIHANLEALVAVLDDAAGRHVHRYFCLGDIVGYGPDPNGCIELVRSLPRANCLAGNHDAAVTWRYSPYNMNRKATEAIFWTMDQLTKKHSDFLEDLPLILPMGDMLFAHANPYNPGAYRYVLSSKYALRSFRATRARLLFVSHTHRPMIITRKNFFQVEFFEPQGEITCSLNPEKRHIINCGSVGQPRDRDPRACYCILDTRKNTLEFRRVEYDIGQTAKKIQRIDGLSDTLVQRLLQGK